MAQKYNDLYERVQRNLKGIKEVKNYKEMCDILEEDYQKTPSSKERQIERWATCFSFEKKGRSFYGAWDRIDPARVVSYTGYYIGAAGAAGALLKYYSVLKNIKIADFFEYYL